MPVARFSVENYRSFAMRAEVELRPLTLVFGRNSAGKSALLRVLPLLAEAARTSTTDPITLGTPLTRKALFEDIRSRLTRHPWMRFSLEFVPEPGGVGFTFKVSDALENKQQVLEEFFDHRGRSQPHGSVGCRREGPRRAPPRLAQR
jgi:predicted ATP-dependent endonuclease of OLD family